MSQPSPSSAWWRLRPGSVRTQLVVWNMLAMGVLLTGFGILVRYTTITLLIASVDRDLQDRARPPARRGPPPRAADGPGRRAGQPGNPGDPFGVNPPPGSQEGGRPLDIPGLPPDGAAGDDPNPPPGADPNNPNPPPGPGPDDPGGGPQTRLDFPPPVGNERDAGRADVWTPRVFGPDASPISPSAGRGLWDPAAFARSRRHEIVFETLTVNDEPVRVLSLPIRRPQGAVMQVAYPLTDVNRARSTIDRALLLLLPAVALLAGLGGILITGRMLNPVDRLTQQANRIGENRLSDRLALSGDDEFARLANAFNRMLDRLQQAFDRQRALLEQQRRFTADASHELKTPLTVIRGNASVLLGDNSVSPGHREAIQDIEGATGTMTKLVQDLLLLARSDAGQMGDNRQPIPLSDVLGRAIRMHTPRHKGIVADLPPADMLIMGNEDELVRLFSNLIDNAVRYTPPDGQIAVRYRASGGRAQIVVSDTGTGIAKEHLPRLGERFYRVDSARSRMDGGSGLGLAICREIVRAHQGALTIDSKPGHGTSVTVTLPADV